MQSMGNVKSRATVTQIIGDNDTAIPIRKDTKYQEEYFNAKIMEIDQELLRYETSKGGNQGPVADKEKVFNSETETNEVATQSPPEQIISQDKRMRSTPMTWTKEKTTIKYSVRLKPTQHQSGRGWWILQFVARGQHEETAIQPAWGLNFQASRNIVQGISSFSNLVGLVELQHENLELFMVVAWYIWLLRDKNRANEPCILVGKIYEATQSTLTEY
nr:hypothetical protein CFP56_43640 [Quercus suber]